MMAARFRSVTWVAVALVPALACYLVTQHVAAERAELARVERRIGQTRHDIRDLETELGTRGSMAQIERWNTQTLALAAPSAQQFVTGDVQLASLSALPATPRPTLPAVATTAVADVRQAAFAPASKAPAPAEIRVRQASFSPATPAAAPAGRAIVTAVREASFRPAAPASARRSIVATLRQASFRQIAKARPAEEEAQPLLRAATYVKPARDAARAVPTRVAMLGDGPLDARTLADIGRIARGEGSKRR